MIGRPQGEARPRSAVYHGDGFGRHGPDQEAADQSRTGGDGHGVELGEAERRVPHGLRDDLI